MNAPMKDTTRKFHIAPEIIHHMIQSQAGTLSKSILELIMNGVDALAKHITIELDRQRLVVSDDGIGFQTHDDVESLFEVLGFPHDENDHRTYGKFGIGRCQIFNYCTTEWHTGPFLLSVDTKRNGLNYGLKELATANNGTTITGNFYEPLSPSDVEYTIRDLTELALYCPIPVTLNGRQINKIPDEQKWDVEDEDAYMKFDQSSSLSVYNLGVMVRSYSAATMGTGGVIVSKKQLQVNFARNDVLQSECEVWKRVKKHIVANSRKEKRKVLRLNDSDREFLARQLTSGELNYHDTDESGPVSKLKLITDITGKHHPVSRLESVKEFTVPEDDRQMLAVRVHEKKMIFVLDPKTIARFGCGNGEEFATLMRKLSHCEFGDYSRIQMDCREFDDFGSQFSDNHDLLNDNELNKKERMVLRAIRKTFVKEGGLLIRRDVGVVDNYRQLREIRIGVSDTASAWTDGASYIALHRDLLKKANAGVIGFTDLVMILLHEYCHDTSDLESHIHGESFYESYHELVCNPHYSLVGELAKSLHYNYVRILRNEGVKLTQAHLHAEDRDAEVEQYEGV